MTNGQNPKRQRQKELRRQKLEQERKAALARKRRTTFLITLIAGLVLAFIFFRPGQDPGDQSDASATPEPTASADGAAAGPADDSGLEPADPDKPLVTMTTSEGELQIELASDLSPNLTEAFVGLVNDGFYDGLTFHRIVENFAIQGGDPSGDGTGGPGTKTVDPVPDDFRYVRGTVAMAKAGNEPEGTAGSQFFIVPDDSAAERLTPDYAILGRVVSGLDTVDRLNSVETEVGGSGEKSTPVEPVIIEKIEIA